MASVYTVPLYSVEFPGFSQPPGQACGRVVVKDTVAEVREACHFKHMSGGEKEEDQP